MGKGKDKGQIKGIGLISKGGDCENLHAAERIREVVVDPLFKYYSASRHGKLDMRR